MAGELRVADLTIDFWSGLQDTPLQQRHEQLRAPLFREVAARTMQRCQLPSSFTNWEEEDELDEDEFERFREQSAQARRHARPTDRTPARALHKSLLSLFRAFC